MNRSVLMIMGGALIVAILVAMIVQTKLSPPAEVDPTTKMQVLVAKKALMTGDVLTADTVGWAAWPEENFFKGMIQRTDYPTEIEKGTEGDVFDFYDTPLRRNVAIGEPITKQTMIADVKGGNNFLAAAIAPGMRAMSVTVKADTMVGGFIAPGDHVDVIVAYSPSKPSGDAREMADRIVQKYASQTILRDIKVLAVDQVSIADQQYETKPGKTVTLEVTAEGAQILALSNKMGDITLALRRIGDQMDKGSQLPLTTDTTTSDVLRVMEDMKSDNRYIRMYSGTNVQNVPVRPLDPSQEVEK